MARAWPHTLLLVAPLVLVASCDGSSSGQAGGIDATTVPGDGGADAELVDSAAGAEALPPAPDAAAAEQGLAGVEVDAAPASDADLPPPPADAGEPSAELLSYFYSGAAGTVWEIRFTDEEQRAHIQTRTVAERVGNYLAYDFVNHEVTGHVRMVLWATAEGIVNSRMEGWNAGAVDPGSISKIEPPILFLPARLQPGTKATSDSTVTTVRPSSTETIVPIITHRELTVSAPEMVTVPAGTFTAIKVTSLITEMGGLNGLPAQRYDETWWAAGVGPIKSEAFPAKQPARRSLAELVSYKPR